MELPLVSVIIPTYNQPQLLKLAIDSVLAQTMSDYEIIVIDDGCTDGTLELLATYHDLVRVITQPNGGIGVARNRGISEARGRYIAPLDHDDLWLPEKLAIQTEFLLNNPECIAVGVPYATSLAPTCPVFDLSAVRDNSGIVRRPLRHLEHGEMIVGTSALMFDRSRSEGLRYGVVRDAIEDVQFHVGLLCRGSFGIAGSDILAIWRVHRENSSRKTFYCYNGMKLLRDMDSRGEFRCIDKQMRRDLSRYLGNLGRVASVQMLMVRERSKAFKIYLSEFVPQLLLGRVDFLALYPLLIIFPSIYIDRRLR